MTSLLDPTRTFHAAHRSAPGALRTATLPPIADALTEIDLVTDHRPRTRARRGRAVLAGAAVALAGAAAVVGLGSHAPVAPLPAPTAPTAVSSMCTGASCEGRDPTTEGCQQDARSVTSRVVTAERRGFEVPVGVVELRASATCRATWARYTVDPTAPIGAIAVQSRDGRSERTPVDTIAAHRHLGYGTTPMLANARDVRALATPAPGGQLPSATTAWTG